jgi:hypothetical protein
MNVHRLLSPISLGPAARQVCPWRPKRDRFVWMANAAFSRPTDQADGNFSDPSVRHAITLVAWADDDFLNALARVSGHSSGRFLAARDHLIVTGLCHCPGFD